VSFISLSKILPHVTALAAPRAELVALIKPQFEAGKTLVRKELFAMQRCIALFARS
jgi:23S rRNA (cytidine1920-2'-O)/16S rRNA (cytidine1409-2'-O)-methyltransferase